MEEEIKKSSSCTQWEVFQPQERVSSCCLQEKMQLDIAILSNLGQSQKDMYHCFLSFVGPRLHRYIHR